MDMGRAHAVGRQVNDAHGYLARCVSIVVWSLENKMVNVKFNKDYSIADAGDDGFHRICICATHALIFFTHATFKASMALLGVCNIDGRENKPFEDA